MCQVSRFDPWKDPLGVIDAYRIVKERIPTAQLALVGSMASDDPEGWDFFNATIAHADGDPDIHILNNYNNVGAIEVNAFQSHSDVLVQKSTREGFGLTVSEAIWKAKPFIGGDVGGIPLQVEDGVTGFLVSSTEQCAERALEILEDRPGQVARQTRQGARAGALSHAALPSRLLADLQRAQGVMSTHGCAGPKPGDTRLRRESPFRPASSIAHRSKIGQQSTFAHCVLVQLALRAHDGVVRIRG
jgi:trehalose synthase